MNLTPLKSTPVPLPAPRTAVSIRPGTMDDFTFIDALQGSHTKQVGWMPREQLEGKIRQNHVIIAENEAKQPLGFCIGNDQYFKRDDCGIIYQLCVVKGERRGLIGAVLVKAMFERAAWGCRLFSCWCAQDIEANHFWESLGFVPLAFRAGSRTKGKGKTPRIHIFWQKRIREGDTTTPWWFPSETKGGSIREDRIVLPIPPDTHWSEVKRPVLPGDAQDAADADSHAPARRKPRSKPTSTDPIARLTRVQRKRLPVNVVGGLRYMAPAPAPVEAPRAKPEPTKKNNPKLVAAARELRDRYLEAVNRDSSALLPQGKYEVARALLDSPSPEVELKALPEAA